MFGITWCSKGGGRRSGEVAKRSSQVGKIRKVVMDRRFSKNPPRVPIFSIALRQRSSARSQTVWKAKASRFRETNPGEKLPSPCQKLFSSFYPCSFEQLSFRFSIFQPPRHR